MSTVVPWLGDALIVVGLLKKILEIHLMSIVIFRSYGQLQSEAAAASPSRPPSWKMRKCDVTCVAQSLQGYVWELKRIGHWKPCRINGSLSFSWGSCSVNLECKVGCLSLVKLID